MDNNYTDESRRTRYDSSQASDSILIAEETDSQILVLITSLHPTRILFLSTPESLRFARRLLTCEQEVFDETEEVGNTASVTKQTGSNVVQSYFW